MFSHKKVWTQAIKILWQNRGFNTSRLTATLFAQDKSVPARLPFTRIQDPKPLSLIVLAVIYLGFALTVQAADLTLLPGSKQYWHFPEGITSEQRLSLSGNNSSDNSVRLLIRIDHNHSHNYHSRFNRELLLPPGDFQYRLNLDHLHTESKHAFTSQQIRRIYLVTLEGDLQWQKVQLIPSQGLPKGMLGWDFGPEKQNLAPGFKPVTSDTLYTDPITGQSKSIVNGQTNDRQRPYFDTALQDGIEGLKSVTLPISNGLWHLQLWVEDIGEWEYLPHALHKTVTINGHPLLQQQLSHKQWLKQVYLQQAKLPTPAELIQQQQSADTLSQLQHQFWHGLAKNRGQMLETLVEVKNNTIQLDFQSPDRSGRFISALVATPADNKLNQRLAEYDQSRLENFQQHWPVIKNPNLERSLPEALPNALSYSRSTKDNEPTLSTKKSAQTLYWADQEEVTIRLKIPPTFGKLITAKLPLDNLRIFQATTQLRRAGGQENALHPEIVLSPVLNKAPVSNKEPISSKAAISSNALISKRLTESTQINIKEQHIHLTKPSSDQEQIWLITGRANKAQRYGTKQNIDQEQTQKEASPKPILVFEQGLIEFDIDWLNIKLPTMDKPVGIYLDYAPHLSWNVQGQPGESKLKGLKAKGLKPEQQKPPKQRQAQCDYRFLTSFGLTGVAPALPTPIKGQEQMFKQAAQAPFLAGLQPPFPAYTPVKRLLQHSESYALNQMQQLSHTFDYLLWSLADEPGAFPESDQKLNHFNQRLQQQLPSAKTLAQLNQPEHQKLAKQYNAVLINQGYQLNRQRLQWLKDQGIDTYLYNLPWLRFTAGAYLWRSQAQGFWQWHGRMPTAHPFDPTDGREDDVQLILPTETICASSTVHSNLLALRQGVSDYRWLNWLTQNAKHHIELAILQQEIKQQIALSWRKNTLYKKELTSGLIERIKRQAWLLQNQH